MGRVKNEQVQQALLDAGLHAFLTKGYHGTGLQEVVDAVRVPKGSFYAYFPSKEEYAVAVIEHYSDCFAEKMRTVMSRHRSPRRGLLRFFAQLGREFEAEGFSGGCLLANLTAELEESEPCRRALEAGFATWQAQVTAAMQQGQRAGEFRTDLPAEAMAGLLVDSWEGAVLRMKATRSREPLDRCMSAMLEGYFAS